MISTGILGGTFDPIHNSHIAAAELVKETLQLDEIYLLPDGCPPHKKTHVDNQDRLNMVRIAAERLPGFSVIDMEINRPGTTYTVDTMRELTRLESDRKFTYIIGSDTLFTLETWHEFREVPKYCSMAVIVRDDIDVDDVAREAKRLHDEYGFIIYVMPGNVGNVSSEEIRYRMARALSVDGMLPYEVLRYIIRNDLYTDPRIDMLRSYLSPERYKHTLGVEKTALKLAKQYHADPQKAATAALFHDCAKCAYSAEEMIKLCDENGVVLDDNERSIRQILHAPAGAVIAKTQYGVEDEEVLNAIRWHTTGHKNMTLLEKIVFLADAIEPYRKPYPGLERIREIAKYDLNAAVCQSAMDTQAYVAARSLSLNPRTEDMINDLKRTIGGHEYE